MKKFFDKILSFANTLAGDYYSRDEKLGKKSEQLKSSGQPLKKGNKARQQSMTGSDGADVSYGAGI